MIGPPPKFHGLRDNLSSPGGRSSGGHGRNSGKNRSVSPEPSQPLEVRLLSWSKAPRVGRRPLPLAATGAHPRKPTAVGSGLYDPPMHSDKTAKVANHGCSSCP